MEEKDNFEESQFQFVSQTQMNEQEQSVVFIQDGPEDSYIILDKTNTEEYDS